MKDLAEVYNFKILVKIIVIVAVALPVLLREEKNERQNNQRK